MLGYLFFLFYLTIQNTESNDVEICLTYLLCLQFSIVIFRFLSRQFFYNKYKILMASKYQIDNYTITVDFKTEFAFSMTAVHNFTDDYYVNQAIQLTKIKKDTVLAAFSKKNQKNLRCEFNVVDVEPKKLMISFIVSYDFLPTFIEYVPLEWTVRKAADLKKEEFLELKSDIDNLNQRLNSFLRFQDSKLTQIISQTLTPKALIFSTNSERGNYLIEITGYHQDPQAVSPANIFMKIIIQYQEKKIQKTIVLYQNFSYGFPFSYRQQISISEKGLVQAYAQKTAGTTTLSEIIATIVPIYKIQK